MEETGLSHENSILKNALCVKEHEIFVLQTELEKRTADLQSIVYSVERMERTIAACFDRLVRRLERSGSMSDGGKKRHR